MTNILIVDDEYDKAREISDLILSIDSKILIKYVATSSEARKHIHQEQYDLALIDINIPDSIGSRPNLIGGIDLFDIILVDQSSKIPLDILFITEKEDSVESYITESQKRGAALCRFSSASNDWKEIIIGRIKLAKARNKRSNAESPSVDVAIITALGNPELDAVLQLPYNWQNRRFNDDPTGYHFGKKGKDDKFITLVAASPRRKGMPSSSALAMKMVERFKPKYLVMLGICAGVEGKVNLGDIIVADPSWDWGSGKLSQDLNGSQIFSSSPHQVSLEHHISQLSIETGSDPKIIASIISGWQSDLPKGKLKVHVGPLASGSLVLAADNFVNHISSQNRDLIGIDMEAYAVMAISDFARKKNVVSIVIKSVCDYADSTKENLWQNYSSYTSAAFFDKLIENEHFPI